ncbi:hypothetical protein ASPWEDRAFT_103635 [Aspergillus wentii DTO 134E9]|uniref:Glycosyl hydrolase family 32 N-terminal domain-containing protein n=1 Tax=Aspergillus wentii DTO 134E9 TaxID=1073089 RepID=A0A1L9RUC3_ASPWE|nr:uncharacterized protein ASPWEDRAFT_103635 [Aspergillus wentii DTO 134E9]KAI9934147.1 hypothetical protein MW887_005220 [Aspergillus wentii]OJJ38522.1 hypothetical protein ASPWEDRAFT_103635 [Aspergillus wentii DTO 134E9]
MSIIARRKGVEVLPISESSPQVPNHERDQESQPVEHQTAVSREALRWRPSFHLTAPHGWLNDPCGLGYDPATGLYHLAFQWNPIGNDWGNISWGHSVSSDLVLWKTSPHPCLTPSADYDNCGVFTGCLQSSNINGEPGALTYIYTSVGHLPIHYTLPYVAGSESLSLAVSHDGGTTWQRQNCNPILPGSPPGVNVTGWRDPYIGAWPSMQRHPNIPSSNLYGFISGGIVSETPTVFVYTVNPKNLKEWKYIGPLIDVGLNFRPSRWSGDFGVNWEVSTLTTLTDSELASRDFIITGAEGCLEIGNPQKRVPRSQLWMCVKPRSELGKHCGFEPLTTYAFGGIFDHGCFYAANSFWDPVTSQQIVYGWITEEDLPDSLRHRQGWSGLISLPRAIKLMTLHNVKKARRSELKKITSIETEVNSHGTYTVRTLGVQPDQRLGKLRALARKTQLASLQLQSASHHARLENTIPLKTPRWEMNTEFVVNEQCALVGIEIGHNPEFSCRTLLSWNPSGETFTIKRPQVLESGINHSPEVAPHTLFTFDDCGEEKEETLRVQAYFDKSVLEVFVNERTVISTRVYSPEDSCAGLRFFAESNSSHADSQGHNPAAVLVHANVWDGLGNESV